MNNNSLQQLFKIFPSKKMGQNFLINNNIAKKIANLINENTTKQILEIGPGYGAITKNIDFSTKEYFGVELDKRLHEFLIKNFTNKNIKFFQKDFLQFVINENLNQNGKVLLFGNIPYSISSPIIFNFLEQKLYQQAIFMVQKEYFERITADCKTKEYSSFSILMQTFCEVKKILDVNKNNFYPIPDVNSVVFQLDKKPNVNWDNYLHYSKFIRQCFMMRRKTLNNNLKSFISQENIFNIFKELKLNNKIRPEELSVEQFQILYQKIYCK